MEGGGLGDMPRFARCSWMMNKDTVNEIGRIWLSKTYGAIVRVVNSCF